MKQTAVEWLMEELMGKFELKGDLRGFEDIVDQAKEMEKEQKQQAYDLGADDAWNTFYEMSKS